jgi:nicotinamide riboside kinase
MVRDQRVCVFFVRLIALLGVAATGDDNALVQRQQKIPSTLKGTVTRSWMCECEK